MKNPINRYIPTLTTLKASKLKNHLNMEQFMLFKCSIFK